MERKNQYIFAIIILCLALIITSVGWLRSHSELAQAKLDSAAQYQDSLAVCETSNSTYDAVACVGRLTDLSNLLSKYAEKIKTTN